MESAELKLMKILQLLHLNVIPPPRTFGKHLLWTKQMKEKLFGRYGAVRSGIKLTVFQETSTIPTIKLAWGINDLTEPECPAMSLECVACCYMSFNSLFMLYCGQFNTILQGVVA